MLDRRAYPTNTTQKFFNTGQARLVCFCETHDGFAFFSCFQVVAKDLLLRLTSIRDKQRPLRVHARAQRLTRTRLHRRSFHDFWRAVPYCAVWLVHALARCFCLCHRDLNQRNLLYRQKVVSFYQRPLLHCYGQCGCSLVASAQHHTTFLLLMILHSRPVHFIYFWRGFGVRWPPLPIRRTVLRCALETSQPSYPRTASKHGGATKVSADCLC